MYIFFDTETTGLPKNWKAPVEDLDNWPRLVQLAWIIYDDNKALVSSEEHIVYPSGFQIPEAASNIHGITTHKAILEGKNLDFVLDRFYTDLKACSHIIAHNLNYDINIMGAELLRNNKQNILPGKKGICTMLSSVDFCALPGKYGYKWPSLSELHIKLFNKDFENAHDAMSDIKATADCFFALEEKYVINL
ncbi:MAG TPA: 3'-5' exonuclease [Bacteroidetes bacterium]|nr:3'-5' exonuclease [Bacteroidota bacterium]